MGLPAWEEAELNGSRVVRTKVLGQQQEWVEAPWTWITHQEIHQERVYKKGLMHRQTGAFKILPEKTSDGSFQVEISFNWYGNFLLRFLIGPLSANFLQKQMTAYVRDQEKIFFANAQAKNTALTPLRSLTSDDHQQVSLIMADVKSNSQN